MAVDRETGHVAMQAAGARFEADFPASVVAEMKTGDIVLVTVNVTDTRTAAIAGPITSVDPDKGTDHGEWPLHVQCGSREAEGDEAR